MTTTTDTVLDITLQTEAKSLLIPAREVRPGDVLLEGTLSPDSDGASRVLDYEAWGIDNRIGQTIKRAKYNRTGAFQIFFGETVKVTIPFDGLVAVERLVPTAAALHARRVEKILFEATYKVNEEQQEILRKNGYRAKMSELEFVSLYAGSLIASEARLAVYKGFLAAVSAPDVDVVEAAATYAAQGLFTVLQGRGVWHTEGLQPVAVALAGEARVEAWKHLSQFLTPEALAASLTSQRASRGY